MSRRLPPNSWIVVVAVATFLALSAIDAISNRPLVAPAAAQQRQDPDCNAGRPEPPPGEHRPRCESEKD
jgi:hypothetical protein